MFDADCPSCGRVLVTTRRVIVVERQGPFLVVRLRCWCGGVAAARIETRAGAPRSLHAAAVA